MFYKHQRHDKVIHQANKHILYTSNMFILSRTLCVYEGGYLCVLVRERVRVFACSLSYFVS